MNELNPTLTLAGRSWATCKYQAFESRLLVKTQTLAHLLWMKQSLPIPTRFDWRELQHERQTQTQRLYNQYPNVERPVKSRDIMRTKPALLLQLFSRGQKPKLEIIQPEVNPEPNSYSPKIIGIYTKQQDGTASEIQVIQDTTGNERRMAVLLTETTVSAITEGVSAADSSKGGILTKLFIMGAILLVTVVSVKKWFFPYTMDDLESQITCVGGVIKRNMTLEMDLLGDMGWVFRDQLDGKRRRMCEIQEWATTEPKRWRLLAWVVFCWREMKEVQRCYDSVMSLKRDVMV
ncbi:hypothetical protein PM082_013815 [Marasmius tenuissimus]|nr:hypothetical protein PM082_013815 [Marasmius tenuissimus]